MLVEECKDKGGRGGLVQGRVGKGGRELCVHAPHPPTQAPRNNAEASSQREAHLLGPFQNPLSCTNHCCCNSEQPSIPTFADS